MLEAQRKESAFSIVVEKLQREVAHFKGDASTSKHEAAKSKKEDAREMEEETLLKTELPKRLEESTVEAIKNLWGSEEFRISTMVWSCSILSSIIKKVSP